MNSRNPYVRLVKNKADDKYLLHVLFNLPKTSLPDSSKKVIPEIIDEIIDVRFELIKQPEEKVFEPASAEVLIPYSKGKKIIVRAGYKLPKYVYGPETDGETIIHFEDAVEE